MINKVILMGRLVRDPETTFIQSSNSSKTRFTIAVERDYKEAGEERPKADFINCTAWNKTGEFIAKYFKKGNMIGITGSIRTGSYTNKEGVKVYTTEVGVSEATFTGERINTGTSEEQTPPPYTGDFMDIPDDIEEGVPWK